MAARRIQDAPRPHLSGGPLDGLRVDPVSGAFAWIDADGGRFAEPGPGRFAYRRIGRDVLAFMGHGARRCGGCGGMLSQDASGRRLEHCPLCGASADG